MRKTKNAFFRKMIAFSVTALAYVIGAEIAGQNAMTVHAASPVAINETNFPDVAFRSVIAGRDYDRNGNGVLEEEEIGLILNMYCDGMGIKSLKGIEYLVDLQGLYCTNNQIESMDLSANNDLRGVWCSDNKFTSLDFSANPKLTWVYCYDCNLTNLNISNNPLMAYVECNTNPLKTLDVTHNPLLEHLTCGTCELTELNLSNNPILSHLDAFSNHLTALDISHNPELKRLDIWNNQGLGSIDVSHNQGLQYYNCAYNGATSVDVSQNPKLQKLICSYNQIENLDLSHNPELIYLDCAVNQIGTLDLSKNQKLQFLQAFTNPFTTLRIGDSPALVKVYNEGTKRAEYAVCRGHSWTIDYGGEVSTGGDDILFLCVDDAVTVDATKAQTAKKTLVWSDGIPENAEELLTREMVVKTLYDMTGRPSVKGLKTRFADVIPGAWYEDALLWGEKHSICMGYPETYSNRFGVGEWATRQDVAFMLMRYAEYKNYKRAIDFGRTDPFFDYYEIDQYAWEAMTWAVTWEIINVKGDPNAPRSEQRLDPQGKATREDLEYMIRRMMTENKATIDTIPIPEKSKVHESILKRRIMACMRWMLKTANGNDWWIALHTMKTSSVPAITRKANE